MQNKIYRPDLKNSLSIKVKHLENEHFILEIYNFNENQIVMGEFVTLRNEESISVSFSFSSLAKRYREGKFYILNKDETTEFFQLQNWGEQQAMASKRDLYEHSLLVIRLQCIVSRDLLDQKETILKNTLVDYKVEDERKTKNYASDYAKDPTEYVDKTTYTFVITKYIEIKFES